MAYGFHNHSRHSRPDGKMSRNREQEYRTSVQRRVQQMLAAHKRRQRDRKVVEDG